MSVDIEAMFRRASQLFHAGCYHEAVPAYSQALSIDAARPSSWFNLAMALRKTRRFEEALVAYTRALAENIDGPEEVHLRQAAILSDDLARFADARIALGKALRLRPDYVPALLNLGNLEEDEGNRAAALDCYQKASEFAPDDALALARLAAATDAAGATDERGAGDAIVARLRAALARVDATPEDRADLGFALGDRLDRLGAFDEAFQAYADANRESRSIAAASGWRYDQAAQERFIDSLIEAFPRNDLPSRDAEPGVEDRPIFICGMFRSGSTLAEAMLARHSQIRAGGELGTLPSLIMASLSPYPQAAVEAPASVIDALRTRYLAETADRRAGGRLIDKRPDNFLHVGLIKRMFPHALIINTTRNLMDNCLSIWFLHLDRQFSYANELMDIRHFWLEQRRLVEHWKMLYPKDIFDFDYDRFVREPATVMRSLVAFCGLTWEEAVLQAEVEPSPIRTASQWQVRRPIYQTSSGRWRKYERHLHRLLDHQEH